MRSMAEKGIAIDITNICNNSCSNCMRNCNYHRQNNSTYNMDIEYFKQIMEKLSNVYFKNTIGIIGGEPLLHPKFKEITACIRQYFPKTKKFFRQPILNFNQYLLEENIFEDANVRLFSAVPPQFYSYWEDIDDTFDSLRLNDHNNNTHHCTILASYKDFNISDDKFQSLKNDCWVQKYCYGGINPQGVYFCEQAANLDLILHLNLGWDINEKWETYTEKDFQKQMELCKYCGARLHLPMNLDSTSYTNISAFYQNIIQDKIPTKTITQTDYDKYNIEWKDKKDAKRTTVDEIGVTDINNIKPKHFLCTNNPTLQADDWIIVNDDKKILYNILNKSILNIGCFYYINDSYAYNIHSKALANINNITMPIWAYYPLNKLVNIHKNTNICNYNTQEEKILKKQILFNKLSKSLGLEKLYDKK